MNFFQPYVAKVITVSYVVLESASFSIVDHAVSRIDDELSLFLGHELKDERRPAVIQWYNWQKRTIPNPPLKENIEVYREVLLVLASHHLAKVGEIIYGDAIAAPPHQREISLVVENEKGKASGVGSFQRRVAKRISGEVDHLWVRIE